jgi:hypothetical protein
MGFTGCKKNIPIIKSGKTKKMETTVPKVKPVRKKII